MTKMNTKDYTKQYIINALLALMKVKNYSEITISEITNKAGVGRVTYYRNFNAKEDIIIEFFNQNASLFIDEQTISLTKADYYHTIVKVFKLFKEHYDFFKILVNAHLEYLYLNYLNKRFEEYFMQNNKTVPIHYAYLYAGSLFNISMEWLKNGCKESAEDIAKIMFYFVFPRH